MNNQFKPITERFAVIVAAAGGIIIFALLGHLAVVMYLPLLLIAAIGVVSMITLQFIALRKGEEFEVEQGNVWLSSFLVTAISFCLTFAVALALSLKYEEIYAEFYIVLPAMFVIGAVMSYRSCKKLLRRANGAKTFWQALLIGLTAVK